MSGDSSNADITQRVKFTLPTHCQYPGCRKRISRWFMVQSPKGETFMTGLCEGQESQYEDGSPCYERHSHNFKAEE